MYAATGADRSTPALQCRSTGFGNSLNAASRPSSALPLLIGVAFTCAAATTLGIVSSNPKTFIVAFLMFWYIATQDKGLSPSLDFAGWFGTATPAVMASYAALTLALLATAHLFHTNELRRRW
jgi:hypothetical protein